MRGIDSAGCDLDETLFHCIEMKSIPDGSAAVAVTVDNNSAIYKARMVAGSVGIRSIVVGIFLTLEGPETISSIGTVNYVTFMS